MSAAPGKNPIAKTEKAVDSKAVDSKAVDSKALREWAFDIGDRNSSLVVYRSIHRVIRTVLFPFLRVEGQNVEVLDLPGATILAPVHRSNLDSVLLATLSQRRIRALGKESLFTVPVLKYFCAALGAIPVRRGEADREALMAAKRLLDRGESMIVFPEGGRQNGHDVGELFDGAAWLAAKTGARVVPVGMVGTGEAMGEGSRFLRRSTVRIVVGEPLEPPTGANGKSADRDQQREFTKMLGRMLQDAQDQARDLLP